MTSFPFHLVPAGCEARLLSVKAAFHAKWRAERMWSRLESMFLFSSVIFSTRCNGVSTFEHLCLASLCFRQHYYINRLCFYGYIYLINDVWWKGIVLTIDGWFCRKNVRQRERNEWCIFWDKNGHFYRSRRVISLFHNYRARVHI